MGYPSDQHLLELLEKDSKKAFEAIYRRYWERLYAYAFKMSADRDLSQNIVQDIFVSLWKKIDNIEIETLDTYLFQAVKYQVFKSYRDQKLSKEVLESRFEDFVFENPATVTDPDLSQSVFDSINKLPEKRKEIFLMNKLHDLSIDQIATELEISQQTVKNQLSSALKQLRFDLNDL
ncbi:RNA polymerase sigma-70 factor [Reichenbachiella agarivorans]|uniref:RNA polymerase sigma-70 factor n=1 Tax=Reichenbachiella agarivorans TaxID=2979464 RepID=A0ABY6CQS2_9BACT|nr:RNA polymerase sigma-70 factor [Reichenbachiella agarivorans]UXP32841.1 RNA polymerase sigma-70 factor [Reichenbachiella agarivorans]